MSYAHELLEEGRAEGKVEGREEGFPRGKFETLEGLLRVGADWNLIRLATGIDESEFRALKERWPAPAQERDEPA